MPKEIKQMPDLCPNHDFTKTAKIRMYSMDSNMVFNPLKLDTINDQFKRSDIKFEIESIIPTYINFDIDLADSRRNEKLEASFLQEVPPDIDLVIYFMRSKTQLIGYAVVSSPEARKRGLARREIYLRLDASAADISHEIAHQLGLLDNVGGHCSHLMTYSLCSYRFSEDSILRMKGFFIEHYLKIRESF